MSDVILLVDDNAELLEELADFLSRYEFLCLTADSWDRAEAAIRRDKPDLIVLDQFLGTVDTVPRLRLLRQITSAPVLMLTSNTEEADRIVGLELGADDFLRKPISGRELVARVRAHLRRRSAPVVDARAEREWRIDDAARRLLQPDGNTVRLTSAEFDLLAIIAANPGTVHSRDSLSRAVFNRPWHPGDRAVDTIVANLRAKIDPRGDDTGDASETCIVTVRNGGYSFVRFPSL